MPVRPALSEADVGLRSEMDNRLHFAVHQGSLQECLVRKIAKNKLDSITHASME